MVSRITKLKLNRYQRAVLIGVCLDREFWLAQDWNPRLMAYRDLGAHRVKIQRARDGVVALAASRWLGRPLSPSDKVGLSRAYARLEAAGLIVRHFGAGGISTSHLSLTNEGEKLVKELTRPRLAQ